MRTQRLILIAAVVLAVGYVWLRGGFIGLHAGSQVAAANEVAQSGLQTATFAGGCFWCVEADFDKVPGVISTTSGYIGGTVKNPTYQQVSGGTTGHAEAVEIVYDPAKVTYAKLLDTFWRNIDPLAKDKQFCDSGNEYRSAIFYLDDEQKKLADELMAEHFRRMM